MRLGLESDALEMSQYFCAHNNYHSSLAVYSFLAKADSMRALLECLQLE
jgi:hypothetical protein